MTYTIAPGTEQDVYMVIIVNKREDFMNKNPSFKDVMDVQSAIIRVVPREKQVEKVTKEGEYLRQLAGLVLSNTLTLSSAQGLFLFWRQE